jgi:hypothetical protein
MMGKPEPGSPQDKAEKAAIAAGGKKIRFGPNRGKISAVRAVRDAKNKKDKDK